MGIFTPARQILSPPFYLFTRHLIIHQLSKYMKKKQLTREQCAVFNEIRRDCQMGQYSIAKLTEILLKSSLGWKLTSGLLKGLVENECIIRSERGKYMFPKDPVHISRLQAAYESRNKLKNRKRVLATSVCTEEQAIEVLKKNPRYRVYKATLSLERALNEKDKAVRELLEWIEV